MDPGDRWREEEGEGLCVQGYYSTKDKTLYRYDDVRGAYRRGVLVHEMVHALQDQHFGLNKLHATSFGSDAEKVSKGGYNSLSAAEKERSYQVMTIWDEVMGASAASFQKERRLRRVVVLAGSGHVERGFGIPDRATKRSGGKAVTVRIVVGGDPVKVLKDPAADFVLFVK